MTKIKKVTPFDETRPTHFKVKWEDGITTDWDLTDLDPKAVAQAAWHGVNQKTMDAHSGGAKKGWSPRECRATSQAVWDRLVEGVWNAAGGRDSIMILAITEVLDKTTDEAREIWGALDDKAKRRIEQHPDILRWKADRAEAEAKAAEADGADLSDLLTIGEAEEA